MRGSVRQGQPSRQGAPVHGLMRGPDGEQFIHALLTEDDADGVNQVHGQLGVPIGEEFVGGLGQAPDLAAGPLDAALPHRSPVFFRQGSKCWRTAMADPKGAGQVSRIGQAVGL